MRVVIIGAGLAGLATAVDLVDAGCEVEIFESRPFVGGKVGSWVDADGNHVEMGLHVFFGCYYQLFELMQKVYIIKPNFCIAFAGLFEPAMMFLKAIRKYCDSLEVITFESIKLFFQTEEIELKETFGFIIMMSQIENGDLILGTMKQGKFIESTSDIWGTISATGSGAESFIEQVTEKTTMTSSQNQESIIFGVQAIIGLISPIIYSISMNYPNLFLIS